MIWIPNVAYLCPEKYRFENMYRIEIHRIYRLFKGGKDFNEKPASDLFRFILY